MTLLNIRENRFDICNCGNVDKVVSNSEKWYSKKSAIALQPRAYGLNGDTPT